MNYPFADLELARRLERTEGQGNVDFIEARRKAFPDWGAEWIEVAGTRAMFDGPGSPLTQTFGLGIFEALTVEQLDEIEGFFLKRGVDVFHEVCPLADPSTFVLLNELMQARLIRDDEVDLWAQTAFEGWKEFTEVADFLRDLGRLFARSRS